MNSKDWGRRITTVGQKPEIRQAESTQETVPSPAQQASAPQDPAKTSAHQKQTAKEAADSRRRHPRVMYDLSEGTRVPIGEQRYPLVDISEGGICFLSDTEWRAGTIIKFNPVAATEIDLTVLKVLPNHDPAYPDHPYRVHTGFPNDLPHGLFQLVRERFYR
ncbi:MAG: PilZ domain-containing protein [Deltaproteobacteria bacterium]|nr:PilZ domain-containing protein [Deltaproteobacteria bacterium]